MIEVRVPLRKGDVQLVVSFIGENADEIARSIREALAVLDEILAAAEKIHDKTSK